MVARPPVNAVPPRRAAPRVRRFAALDFETADNGRDSACSVGLAVVEGDRIVERHHALIRPPRREFLHSAIHGITWAHVARAPTFADHWPKLSALLHGADFIAAHNAPFDRSVLRACCEAAGIAGPSAPFVCTMKLARDTWDLRPTRLSDVSRHLGIALQHHDALSDALACAEIVLAARRAGAAV